MNIADEKALMPIPDACRECMHCETWRTQGVERHQCLRGHTMQPGCGWQRMRTPSIMGSRCDG